MIPLDEVVVFDVVTHEPSTGAISDADSTPTYSVFEETTDTPILSAQNFTKRTGLTGNYRGSFTASTANGFEVGKWYSVIATATVDGVTAKCVALHFRLAPAEASAGIPKVDVALSDGGTVPSVDDVADGMLKRDWTSVTGEASRSVLNALRFLRNKWTLTSTTLSVKKEDDSTEAFSATVSTDAAAEPIVGSDPS
jgi:hypothetical protein